MIKIMVIHGVGGQDGQPQLWQPAAQQLVNTEMTLDGGPDPRFHFPIYDDVFQPYVDALDAQTYRTVCLGLSEGLPQFAFPTLALTLFTRWYTGMVVAWMESSELRGLARARIKQWVNLANPGIVIAHSLGGMISYDLFSHEPEILDGRHWITAGTQIGNPFVATRFNAPPHPIANATRWWHLYNEYDHVFTAPLDTPPFRDAANFIQLNTTFGSFFDLFGANHTLTYGGYLDQNILRAVNVA